MQTDRMIEKSLKLNPDERIIGTECIQATANLLSSVHSLRGLSMNVMLNMAKHCAGRCYRPGSKIIRQGDDDHTM
jgi:hypothetical protein